MKFNLRGEEEMPRKEWEHYIGEVARNRIKTLKKWPGLRPIQEMDKWSEAERQLRKSKKKKKKKEKN